jgi:hypothetical protein
MGLVENAVEGAFEGPGLLVGLGAVVAAPVVFPTAAAGLRPVAKWIIGGALALSAAARETFAETGERFSDLVAEVREERGGGAAAAAGAATAPTRAKPKAPAAEKPKASEEAEPRAPTAEKPKASEGPEPTTA